jgi:predicted Zn-dependent protease
LIQVLGADDPRNKRAVRLLMMLLSEQIDAPQRTRILDCLVQWLTLAPPVDADGPVLADLAAALVEQTRYAEAVDVLERLLAIEPASAMAYRYLGEAREGLGHTAEARRAYRRALELAGPSDPQLDWIDHVRQRLEKLPPEGHAP